MIQDRAVSSAGMLGVVIPDSNLVREVMQLIRDTESELLFNHSARVYLWGALLGKRKGIVFDPELLYVAAMFDDLGLTSAYSESQSPAATIAPSVLPRHRSLTLLR